MARMAKTQRIMESLARWTVLCSVVLAAWLFGASDPWVHLPLSQVIGAGILLWLVTLVAYGSNDIAAPRFTLSLGVLAVFVALQIAPLGDSVVSKLNPVAAQSTVTARQLLDAAQTAVPPQSRIPVPELRSCLSFAPAATARSVYLFLIYVGIFLVVANTSRTWSHLRGATMLLVCSGFIMALVSLLHRFSGSQEVFWFHTPRYGGNIFGPFSNRNHFAAHMNMLFGVALGQFLASRQTREILSWPAWRDRLAWLSSGEASQMALSGFTVLMLAGAVSASLSRGALLSLLLTVTALIILVRIRQGEKSAVRSATWVALVALFAAVLWFGGAPLAKRIGKLTDIVRNPFEDFRTIVTWDTARLYMRCPAFGCGFGSFRHAFPTCQSPGLEFRWLHAHNDWAQLFAEGGTIGAVLFGFAIWTWGRDIARRFKQAPQRCRLLVVGLLTGICTLAIHSLVDYSLHKPANAMLLAAMAGLCTAAARLCPQDARQRARFFDTTTKPPRKLVRLVALLLVFGFWSTLILHSGDMHGEIAFARLLYYSRLTRGDAPASAKRVAVAAAAREADLVLQRVAYDPDAFAECTTLLLEWGLDASLERSFRTDLVHKALHCGWRAVQAAPTDYLCWLGLARAQMSLGLWDGAETSLEQARQLVVHPKQVRMFSGQTPDSDRQ
jgi:hypothetical protein